MGLLCLKSVYADDILRIFEIRFWILFMTTAYTDNA